MLVLIVILVVGLGIGAAVYFIAKNKKNSKDSESVSPVPILPISSSIVKRIGSVFLIPTAYSDQELEEEIVWLRDHNIGTDPFSPNILWGKVTSDESYRKVVLAADLHRKNGMYFGIHIPANDVDAVWVKKLWTSGIIHLTDKQVAIYLDSEIDLLYINVTGYLDVLLGKDQLAWFTSAISMVESLLGTDQKLTVILSPYFSRLDQSPSDIRTGYTEFLKRLISVSIRGNQYISAIQDGVGCSDKPVIPEWGKRVPGDNTFMNLLDAHYNACDDAGVKGLVNLELFSYNTTGSGIVAAYSRITEQIRWEVKDVSGPCWVFDKTPTYDLTEFKKNYTLGE